jgi:hypothetical protein
MQGAAQPFLLGGGVLIQGPAQDSSDPSSQHGFLQMLDIHVSNSIIEGNAAAEGGGLWSAWPLRISNCSIWHNLATHAVSSQISMALHMVACQLDALLCC